MKKILLLLALIPALTFAATTVPWVKNGGYLYNPYFTDRVGIGTTTPYATLTVASSTVPAGSTSLLFSVATTTSIFNVLANGKVGLGTESPSEIVEIVGTDPFIRLTNSSTGNYTSGISMYRNSVNQSKIFNDGSAVNLKYATYAVASSSNPLYGAHQWQTSPVTSGTLVTQMTLLGGGNLGIGTTLPAQRLHVVSTGGIPAIIEGVSAVTAIGSTVGPIIANTNATPNNYAGVFFGGNTTTASAGIGAQLTDRTSSYGDLVFANRSASGYTEKMRITSAGNVGIGTTTPANKLDVYATDGAKLARFRDTDSTYDGLVLSGDVGGAYVGNKDVAVGIGESIYFQNSTNAMRLYTNGSERMRITSTGNVGIGTSTPGVLLTLGGAQAGISLDRTANDSFVQLSSSGVSGGQLRYIDTNIIGIADVNGTDRVAFNTSSGRVGIGTTSPNAKLDIQTTDVVDLSLYTAAVGQRIMTTDSAAAGKGGVLTLGGSYTGTTQVGFASLRGGLEVIGSSNGYLGLYTTRSGTGSVEAMRITSAGLVGIGTTTPTAKLDVFGTAGSTDKLFNVASSSLTSFFTVLSNGNVGVGTTTPAVALTLPAGKGILVAENIMGTSTSMTLDFAAGSNPLIRLGTAATAIGFTNIYPGAKINASICNPPNAAGGALTFTGVTWPKSYAGVMPTQDTTAGNCLEWQFKVTSASGTVRIYGSAPGVY